MLLSITERYYTAGEGGGCCYSRDKAVTVIANLFIFLLHLFIYFQPLFEVEGALFFGLMPLYSFRLPMFALLFLFCAAATPDCLKSLSRHPSDFQTIINS